jgi:transcriptional regulator with XRE-family HTH domain
MTQTDPLPQQLRELRREGKSQREIARLVHMSQSEVQRQLAKIDVRRRQTWMTVMCTLLTLAAVVLAAAVATIAWG